MKLIQTSIAAAFAAALSAALAATVCPDLSWVWIAFAVIGGALTYVLCDLQGALAALRIGWRELRVETARARAHLKNVARRLSRRRRLVLKLAILRAYPSVFVAALIAAASVALLGVRCGDVAGGVAAAIFFAALATFAEKGSLRGPTRVTEALRPLRNSGCPAMLRCREFRAALWEDRERMFSAEYREASHRINLRALLELRVRDVLSGLVCSWFKFATGASIVAAAIALIVAAFHWPLVSVPLVAALCAFWFRVALWRALVATAIAVHSQWRLVAGAGCCLGTIGGLAVSLALGTIGSPIAVALAGGACGGLAAFALAGLSGLVVRRAALAPATA